MKNFIRISIPLGFLLLPLFSFAQTPPGVDIVIGTCTTANCISLLDTAKSIAGWLIVAGGVLAGITIIATGIMYLTSGGNPQKMTGAKSMFKAGIIGALIIFSPGLIINTIGGFATNPLGFFGGGGTSGTGVIPPPPPPPGDIAYGCSSNNTCIQVAGGIFADTTCAGQCGGAGGQAIGGVCNDCINQGNAFCLVDSTCVTNELACPGVFTRLSGGCP